MKTLYFDYYMQIDYSQAVSSCHFTIKCLPKRTMRQEPGGVAIELFPDVPYSVGIDSFDTRQIYGTDNILHDTFHFRISGNVKTGLSEYEEAETERMTAVFRHPHGLNVPGEALKKYHNMLDIDSSLNVYDKSIFIMHDLFSKFTYEKGCTGTGTTAEEAWQLRRGVCQDYAHILIALLHMEKIPARYVTGMMLGEGASHAWVEILHNGKWYGIDPTNDAIVGDNYIKIGSGRDAADCLINRGIMHGGGTQIQTVNVLVTEQEEDL